MDKVSRYLAEHLAGEVINDSKIRETYSHDASILQIKPTAVVYPRSAEDIQKITRFSFRLAERGLKMPITARGNGTDQTGAAIGEGIIAVFPAHLNHVMELDEREQRIRVQAGMNYKGMEDILSTHRLALPVYPLSYQTSTVGGAIANNSSGEKSVKYGAMRNFVDRLEVVLANGEIIETGRLNKSELSRKKGLPGLEGEIYRQLDGLISDNEDIIKSVAARPVSSNVGYAIEKVRHADGSFDLTQLFVGSQGTLGIITQAILRAEAAPDSTTLVGFALEGAENIQKVVDIVTPLKPSILDYVDKTTLDMTAKITGRNPAKIFTEVADPAGIFLIEFDNVNVIKGRKTLRQLGQLLTGLGQIYVADDANDEEKLWSICHSTNAIARANFSGKVAVPIIDDATVPLEMVGTLVAAAKDLAEKKFVDVAIWGHIGAGSLTVMPFIDLTKLQDRQNIITMMNRYYSDVLELGGAISGSKGDGRLRAPFSERQSGEQLSEVFAKVKEIFDPHGILNPNVKIGTDVRELITKFRSEYNNHRLSDHQPRN
ncbi:MAG: FAD-binding oxidoreductase [Candidatus Nomurabacteria bacterium]|jgi:FAD/FMN-containing dehydrogenase|nr:FAD-binding oxidoreductase [Candidatus Nomurabacteria bacterium]